MNREKRTELAVEGMTFPSCIMHIKRTLSEVQGVSGVEVRIAEGKVIVEHQGIAADARAMVEALQDAGYGAMAA